jgi:hypothetical protein
MRDERPLLASAHAGNIYVRMSSQILVPDGVRVMTLLAQHGGDIQMNVFVRLELHSSCHRQGHGALSGQLGGVNEGGVDVLRLKVVSSSDGFRRFIGSEIVEHHGDQDARTSDTRLPVTDLGINRDSILPGHCRTPAKS